MHYWSAMRFKNTAYCYGMTHDGSNNLYYTVQSYPDGQNYGWYVFKQNQVTGEIYNATYFADETRENLVYDIVYMPVSNSIVMTG